MRDLREVENVDEWQTRLAPYRNAVFVWKRWERPHEDWTHDHCWSCFACVCDHRERFPERKQAHEERGCYRHAYYTELGPEKYLWVCRNCFKRLKSEMNWTVANPQADLEDQAKMEALKVAIAEGLEGPFLDGPTVMAEMRERVRRRANTNREKSKVG